MSARRSVSLATAIAIAALVGVLGGQAASATPEDVVVDDQYPAMAFAGASHSGKVDFFAYECHPGITCRPFDADITVHDHKGDRTVCTDLQVRYGGQRWATSAASAAAGRR